MSEKNAVPAGRRVAVVTGAGTGIGRSVALELLAAGWSVVLAGRRPDPLAEVMVTSAAGDRVLAVPTDVTDPAAVAALFARAVAAYDRVDLLFNNAGVGAPPGSFLEWTPEQWRAVVEVNLNGMFFCLQQAFRTMREQSPRGGRIINNGSISAYAPRPGAMAYTATKHAVTGLTRQAALDGRAYDVAVGQIDVGNAASGMAARMAEGVPQPNGEIVAEPVMDVDLVGRAVRQMAELPLEANVLFQTIMATKMPFVGRG